MKQIIILFGLLFSFLTSFSQIPVLNLKKNIFKMDSVFEKEALSKSYYRAFNRWFSQGDLNNDGKLDLILQPYQHQNRAGIVSIIYNKSDSINNILFENDKLSNFYTEGDPGQFDVGDVNGDGKLDILIMTENYHGKPEDKPLEWYVTPSNDNTVDKLFINNGITGFTRLTFPDTLNSISGKLIDINNDNKKEIIVTNASTPVEVDPTHKDNHILFNYQLSNNKIIRSSIFYSNDINLYSRVSHATEIDNNLYFQLQSLNNQFENPIYVVKFRKGDSLSILSKHDTVAIIQPTKKTKDNYVYTYFPVNEFGIHIVDLDKNGTIEVVTQEAMNIKNSDGTSVANDIGAFNLGENGLSHTRIQVYNKTGNISNQWLDSALQYDPTRIAHGGGIKLEDINNDGFIDIIPIVGWGWWPFTMGDSLIAKEIRKKRLLLNTGNKFQSFVLNFSNVQDLNILQVQSFTYPLFVEKNKPGLILYIKEGGSTSNPSFNETNGVISLDFSQFKFPCSSFVPQNNLKDNFIFCNTTDSVSLKIDSIAGYKTIWQKNATNLKTTNEIIIKEVGSYKVSVTNLGGCIFEKQFTVVKNPIPTTPTISRDTVNNLVSSAALRNTWYKDGVKITDTTQKIKPTTNGIYTATTTQNGCTSALSQGYYYLTNAVANLTNGEYFKVSPNPTSGELNINYKISSSKNINISVFDINGRAVLLNKKVESGSRVNLGSISKGNYIIQVKDGTGRLVASQKLVKDQN